MTDPELIFSLVALTLLISASGFFAGAETALTAVSKARIYHLVVEGNRRARTVSKLREMKEQLIGAILLGNTAVHVGASALATATAIKLWGEAGVPYVALVMTLLVLIFGEVLPKTYAIQNAERCALLVAPFIWFFIKMFSPVVMAVQYFNRAFMKLFGIDITRDNSLISAVDVLRGTIELQHKEGGMVKADRDMLGTILDMDEITVESIMVHRKHVEALNANLPAEEIVRQAVHSTHSRLPLWRDNPENIIGVLHVKNLLRALNTNQGSLDRDTILRITHKPWFIPDTTTLREQLLAFRAQRQHFAMVVDEYGAVLGIVTLEDIIEEIVGEIDDELDKKGAAGMQALADSWYEVEGTVTIRDLNRALDWDLPDEHASTVAGLVMHEARQLPELGAQFEFYGYRFSVQEKKANQVTRLRLKKLPVSPFTE